MNFICEQTEINEALNNVSRAVPAKSPISVLEGIKFSLDKNTLEITGYDLELGIQTKITVNSDDCGEFIVSAKLICEIIRKMPSGQINFDINQNLQVTITGENAEYKIAALSTDDYPSLPDYDTGDNFTLSQALLKNMIGMTNFAVSTLDTKPILTGELFDITDKIFNLAAIDGFRLAVRTEMVDTDDRYYFVVKSKALQEVAKLLKDSDEEDKKVTLHVSKKHIIFEMNGYMVISRLLEGEFHNYKGSIPDKHSTEIIIDTRHLIDSLERCMLLIDDKNKSPVRCYFNDGTLKINCSTAKGKLNDEFKVDISGPSVEIGFNCRYLLDAVKASESDKVKFQLNGGLSPMKIVPLDGDDYIFLVLPVRLKND